MATPTKKILIVRGDESREIRPAYLRTWQRHGWDVAPEGWTPPVDPGAEEVQVVPTQEELELEAASDEPDKNESSEDETEASDLSEDESSDPADAKEN